MIQKVNQLLTNAFGETQVPCLCTSFMIRTNRQGLAGTVTIIRKCNITRAIPKRISDALLVKEGQSYAQLAHPPPPGGRAQKNGTEQKKIIRVALSGALHRKAYSTRSGKQSRSLKPAVRNKPQP